MYKMDIQALYEAYKRFYYRMNLVKEIVTKADINKNALDRIMILVKDTEDEYLIISDAYFERKEGGV